MTAADTESMRLLAPHFDEHYYLTNNIDVAAAAFDPLLHFLRYGTAESRNPSRSFCVRTYKLRYPQAAENGGNVLLHYLRTGSLDGAIVDVVDEGEWRRQNRHALDLQRGSFDAAFYRRMNPDIGTLDALYHFAKFGWLERRDPTPGFSTSGYLALHPDVAAAGLNPFLHWIARERSEERVSADSQAEQDLAFQLEVMRPHFDEAFYLSHLGGGLIIQSNALTHFAQIGWKEGRNPNRSFSVAGYLSTYEDVRRAGVNPFYHYLVEGYREGREQRPQSDYRCAIVTNLQTLEERAATARQCSRDIDAEDLTLRIAIRDHVIGHYAITFSHDDYTRNVGGVQLCLRRDSARYARGGISHIHVFPRRPTLQISQERDPVCGVVINGVLQGYVAATTFVECLAELTERRIECVAFAVHSLLGHTVELIAAAANASAIEEALFWVHDYAAVCAGLRLMRNDVEWCGAPPDDSAACRICVYRDMRSEQRLSFERLFKAVPFCAIAPSEIAATIFRRHHPTVPTTVREHLRLTAMRSRRRSPGAIRIAFLGHPAAHKGWHDFVQLVENFAGDSRVMFLHIATDGGELPNIGYIAAAPDSEGRSSFPDAVANTEVDYTLIGSLWQETFCLTAHEAVAGGAEILTYTYSGQPTILARQGHGYVFSGFAELVAFIEERLEQSDVKSLRRLFDLTHTSDGGPAPSRATPSEALA